MDLKELESFKLGDAVKFHDKLNTKLWHGQHLQPEVKKQLLVIAEDFLQELGISGLNVKDITVSGSNAAYSYTPHSDLDLHILVDMSKLPNDDVYQELFTAKKTLYNDSHDISIHGVPVELYVQDSNQPVVSLGEYSLMNDKWLRIPTKRRANFDQTASKSKYDKLAKVIDYALQSDDLHKVMDVLKTIKRYRQAGLDKGGEFGPENLAFKALRHQGYITKLYALRDKLHSDTLTIENMYQNPELDKPTKNVSQIAKDHDVEKLEVLLQLIKGIKVEKEHTSIGSVAREIALDHLDENPRYYDELAKVGLEEDSESEIHNYEKLDKILNKLCEMVVKGQKSDKDYGMVAACVLDPDNNIVAGLNMPSKDGKRIHAERVAVEKYEKKYGEVPEGSIVITTLSPCNESDDETAEGREGESCTDYLNSKGIKKVYCGYIDPTQDNDQREFNLLETSDKSIREECKKFADTFLDDESKQKVDESSSGYIPSNAEKDDPRYKTALTVDIKPDTMMKNAKKLGSKISRAGIPPTLKASGKF